MNASLEKLNLICECDYIDDDDNDNNIYSGTSNSAVAGLSGALTAHL